MCGRQPKKPKINDKNLPKKSQTRFYGFFMTDVAVRVLKKFRELRDGPKYFWDKPGQWRYYKLNIEIAMEEGDYVMVIICAIIVLFQRERLNGNVKKT